MVIKLKFSYLTEAPVSQCFLTSTYLFLPECEVFRDIDITKNLELLQAPVFIALGRYDYLVPPFYLWENVRDKFQDITIRIFAHSSHNPQLEEATLFNREFLKWLSLH